MCVFICIYIFVFVSKPLSQKHNIYRYQSRNVMLSIKCCRKSHMRLWMSAQMLYSASLLILQSGWIISSFINDCEHTPNWTDTHATVPIAMCLRFAWMYVKWRNPWTLFFWFTLLSVGYLTTPCYWNGICVWTHVRISLHWKDCTSNALHRTIYTWGCNKLGGYYGAQRLWVCNKWQLINNKLAHRIRCARWYWVS